MDTRVSRKTTRGWAKTHRGHKDIEWAESHRGCRKTEWAQTQRVHIDTKSAHKQSWQRHRRKTERGRSDTSKHSRVNRNNTSKQGRYKQSWHKYRADKDVSGCKHREWEDNMRRSGTQENSHKQWTTTSKSDRQHACIRGSMTLPSYNLYNQELFVGLDVCTNSQSQQTLIIQATRLHERKYVLTFLKGLQSGIIRGTRSLHKLAEWRNSHRNRWTFSSCAEMFFVEKSIPTNLIEKPDWRNNLNWILLPANQISETKLDNEIKIGFGKK